MMFLAVLALATAGAALLDRTDSGRFARRGMAIALIFAGAAHLVMPTPFEQHLPGWVPLRDVLVLGTGLIEVGLGLALLWPPGRTQPGRRRTVGRLVAAYLVAVFPANVYVAVGGVEVDGQPGGVYPWLRLPFQAVFVAWVLGSTADPRPTRPASAAGGLPRLRLPWAYGPRGLRAPVADADPGMDSGVVMASRLELARWTDVPAFLLAALRLRALFRRSPGAVALSLRAAPLRRTFWTLSLWESHAALGAFAAHERHVRVMRRFGSVMAHSTFVDWPAAATELPSWPDAAAAITSAAGATVDHGREGVGCGSPS